MRSRGAVKGAKLVGGEAVIIRLISESGVGALTGRSGGSAIGTGLMARTTAQVIRWQTDQEKQARKERDDHLAANQICMRWESFIFGPVGGWIGSACRGSCKDCCRSKVGYRAE